MIKFLDLYQQYLSVKEEIDSAIQEVISRSAFIGGGAVRQFEEQFADFQQVASCVGVGNGTDALEIAIEALELPPGSEIIVPANSFIASSEAVTRTGCRVVFSDVNKDDYTVDVESVRSRITEKTSAIMPVHLYGHPCDLDPLVALARQHGLRVIEDCAQAHGAEYKGRRVGGIGDIGAFSFYPGKNLGAYGDAGAITTNDAALAKKCRMIANHGRMDKYNHEYEGRNSRLDGIQAAILAVKLRYLDQWTEKRIQVADNYRELLEDTPEITLPIQRSWARHVYHLFVIQTHQRDALQTTLAGENIQTGIHYPLALPVLKAYDYLGQKDEEGFAWSVGTRLLSLPMGEHLSEADANYVAGRVKQYFGRG
jgi:dTDP-4-amino-4,6-dideoxygalactose transaminase